MWKNLGILCDNIKVCTGIEGKSGGEMVVSNGKGEIDQKIPLHGLFPFGTPVSGGSASIRAVAVQCGDSEPKMLFTGYGAHRPLGTELGPARVFPVTHALVLFMIVIRVVKAALVAAIALLVSLVAFGNLTDYGTNFLFVQHVMSMDTIYPFSTIRYRAIGAPALHHAAYALIITAEVITAVLCWIGAVLLALQIRADAGVFNRAKTFAVAGLAAGFLLWQVGFISIGGEWFGMWQSQQWNGVPSAFRILITIAAVLIFVAMPDQDFEPQDSRVGRAPGG
jgi:predicted small integral membrane protein